MKKEYKESIPYFIVFISIIAIVITVYSTIRNNKLNKYGIVAKAKIIEIEEYHKRRSLKIDAIFIYVVKDKIFRGRLPQRITMQIGDCYEIVYVKNEPKIVKLNYDKKIECDSVLIDL